MVDMLILFVEVIVHNPIFHNIKNIKKETIFKEVVTKKLTLWGRIKKVLTGI
jgi:hypothetical protein